jgi:hypothetical protein
MSNSAVLIKHLGFAPAVVADNWLPLQSLYQRADASRGATLRYPFGAGD